MLILLNIENAVQMKFLHCLSKKFQHLKHYLIVIFFFILL